MTTTGRVPGALAALLALHAAGAGAQTLAVLPLRAGEASFHVRASIVRDFTGHAPVQTAEYSGVTLAHVRGAVEIRVADMRTGNDTRDRHLRATMDAAAFPLLRLDLDSVEPGAASGDTATVVFVGRLTIHGVTRDVRVPGSVVVGHGTIEVVAGFPLDMRDYGVRPPVRLLGALRVAPDVTVGIHLTFGGPPPAPAP